MHVPEEIRRIAADLRTQDGRCTFSPQYQVRRCSDGRLISGSVFLTNRAAESFAEDWMAENPGEQLEVYVASGYMNPEWEAVRQFLMEVGDES